MPDRILIADDHPQTVTSCRAAMSEAGFEALAASDLPSAAELLQRGVRALAVDAALPGGSVQSFCLRARSAGARVLLLVPPRFPTNELAALQACSDAALFKPFDIGEFTARMAVLAGQAAPPHHSQASAVEERGVAEATGAPPDLAGKRIGGCVLERFLGRGATGCVWLARHELLELPVAVKLLPAALLQWSPQERQRFVRGARAAARIQHPNVVQILHAGEEEGWLFLVQRYVEGESLKARIERLGRLPEREALSILTQIASALGAIHRLGLVHRDVKPANIMLDAAGRALLTDFGLARDAGPADISSVSAIVGTPLYMSPEQCSGAEVDGRSDLYSLGAGIYHALTGRPPIQGETPAAVLRGQQQTTPPPPLELGAGVSPALSALVMRLLAKDPKLRYATAEDAERGMQNVACTMEKEEGTEVISNQ